MARVRIINVQFHIKNPNNLPHGLPDHGQQPNSWERTSYASEDRMPEEGTRCDIRSLRDLERDYVLTQGYSFWRGTEHARNYYVRFVFISRHHGAVPEAEGINGILGALLELTTQALWGVKIWKNPYTSEDAAEGDLAISVNPHDRRPFVGGDGKPITEWRRDDRGVRVGTAPVPLPAHSVLEIHDAMPCIVCPSEEVAAAAQ